MNLRWAETTGLFWDNERVQGNDRVPENSVSWFLRIGDRKVRKSDTAEIYSDLRTNKGNDD